MKSEDGSSSVSRTMRKLKHCHTFRAKIRVRGSDWLPSETRLQVPTKVWPRANDNGGQSSLGISCAHQHGSIEL